MKLFVFIKSQIWIVYHLRLRMCFIESVPKCQINNMYVIRIDWSFERVWGITYVIQTQIYQTTCKSHYRQLWLMCTKRVHKGMVSNVSIYACVQDKHKGWIFFCFFVFQWDNNQTCFLMEVYTVCCAVLYYAPVWLCQNS